MKNSQVLRKALAQFGEEGERWSQGDGTFADFRPTNEDPCAWLALNEATRGIGWSDECAVASILAAELGVQSNDYFIIAPQIVEWNDDPHTTFEDVRLVFKRAIARAEELEAS